MLSCLLAVAVLQIADASVSEDTRASLQQNKKAFRALRITSEFETKVIRKDPAMGGAYFPNIFVPGRGVRAAMDETPQRRWVEDYCRDATRFRLDLEFTAPKGRGFEATSHEVRLFDGKFSWIYYPQKRRATCSSGKTITMEPNMDYYGDVVGYPGLFEKGSRTVGGDIEENYDLADLDFAEYREVGVERVAGERCVVIERPGLDKIWLAVEKDCPVVRREWHWLPGGPLKRRIVVDRFRPSPNGMWLPEAGSMEVFPRSPSDGKPVGTLSYKLLDARIDQGGRFLEPDFPVGTLIHELDTGGRYLFGREQEQIDESVVQALKIGPAFQPQPWWRRPYPLIITTAILLGVSLAVLLTLKSRG